VCAKRIDSENKIEVRGQRLEVRKIIAISILIAIGVILQYVDSIIGGRIGIANIVNIVALNVFSPLIVFFIAISRALIGGLVGGGVMSAMYSICGSLFAVSIMLSFKPSDKISYIGIGILGATAHNLGQIILACALLKSYTPFAYFSYLLVISAITGAIVGYLGEVLYKRCQKYF